MTDDKKFDLSRRKVLGALGTVGAAGALGGAATNALLWDEEVFGSLETPNVLQAGQLDLTVDWDARYFDGIDNDGDGEIDELGDGGVGVDVLDSQQVEPIDVDGPMFQLYDVKPGDVIETTFSLHLTGNPAYLSSHLVIHDDTEGPPANEPEASAEAAADPEDLDIGPEFPEGFPDELGGPEPGELDDYLFHVAWHDDGDNLPEEIWTGPEIDWELLHSEGDSDEEVAARNAERAKFIEALTEAEVTNTIDTGAGVTFTEFDVFDSVGTPGLIFSGTIKEAHDSSVIWPEAVLSPEASQLGNVASDFDDENYKCYEPTGGDVTEYVASLTWLPRDIPGVNDNVIQGDTIGYQFGFEAIQCRHNPLESPGGNAPVDGSIGDADLEGGLSLIRRATAPYLDPGAAIADGYLPEETCVEHPDLGGMGYHFGNPGLIDDTVNPLKPEILVYANMGSGLELVALEYAATEPFEIFGQPSDPPGAIPFESLHVWAWEDNPAGVFAPFNPNVSCTDGGED